MKMKQMELLVVGLALIALFVLPASSQATDSENDLCVKSGGTAIQVKKWILSDQPDAIKYKIEVVNAGTTLLEDVSVTDVLPEGMNYLPGNSRIISSDDLPVVMITDPDSPYPSDADYEDAANPMDPAMKSRGSSDVLNHPGWNLTWSIEKIDTSETFYIYLTVSDVSENIVNLEENQVNVEGTWKFGDETVSDSAKAGHPPSPEQ